MERRRALHALSHEHGQMLAEAGHLRTGAAAASDGEAETAAAAFRAFFQTLVVPHLREEEETLFPLVVDEDDCRPLLAHALLEHQRLRHLAVNLGDRRTMVELAELLETHVQTEERDLFPLIERVPSNVRLASPSQTAAGPVWGEASADLNATLLAWPAGEGAGAQVNVERDVLVYVVEGSATLELDGESRTLRAGDATIVEKGSRRQLVAGPRGVRYLSVHLRRPPLQISPLRPRA